MVPLNRLIEAAQWDAAGQAVRRKKPIERVPRPTEGEGVLDNGFEGAPSMTNRDMIGQGWSTWRNR